VIHTATFEVEVEDQSVDSDKGVMCLHSPGAPAGVGTFEVDTPLDIQNAGVASEQILSPTASVMNYVVSTSSIAAKRTLALGFKGITASTPVSTFADVDLTNNIYDGTGLITSELNGIARTTFKVSPVDLPL
jgi:hypothetical protein